MSTEKLDMTEDDTFRLLSRTPLAEMFNIYTKWNISVSDKRRFHEVLSQNGWTIKEYNRQMVPLKKEKLMYYDPSKDFIDDYGFVMDEPDYD